MAVTFLVPNMRKGPTTNLAVRQAISAALDRNFISDTVYNGYASPTNPMGLLTPNFNAVLDPALAHESFGPPDPAKAKSILQSAGYRPGADGIFVGLDGKRLSIGVKVVAGYTDYISVLKIVAQELRAAGIELQVQAESYAKFTADQSSGNFELLIAAYGFTPSPYAYYDQMLDSRIAPPIGQTDTVGNYGRYANPKVDALLDQIKASPSELGDKQAFYQIERIFMQELPLIPLFEAQNEIEFNGNRVTGYPTQQNPYASPAVYMQPDIGWVAMRLAPVQR